MKKPSVFVKNYRRKKDKTRLRKIIQRHGDKVTVRRAQVLLQSIEGNTVQEIKHNLAMSARHVRQIIHAFNEEGFESLWHIYKGGRKPKFTEQQREDIAQIALLPPRSLKIPVNRWTLSLLVEQAKEQRIVESISIETVRQILMELDVRLRRTKTWKETNDPHAAAKWRRIKRLYRKCPEGSHVISFDPFGPMEIRPVPGRNYCHTKHVKRLPATYSRKQGVRHVLAFLDVHTNEMWGIIVKQKNWKTILAAFRRLRRKYPVRDRIYIILDNASSHKKKEVKDWAHKNKVSLVYTATSASWMNRIECYFDDFRDKVVRGEYPKSHAQLRSRVHSYFRWRNGRWANVHTLEMHKVMNVA